MRISRLVIIPAVLLSLVSAIFLFYGLSQHNAGRQTDEHRVRSHNVLNEPNARELHPVDKLTLHRLGKEAEGAFQAFGTIALICGALSFTWLRVKKKLGSRSKPVKMLAKWMYKLHTYAGWSALVLVALHGGYYLFTTFQKSEAKTGLAAFVLLLTLAVYGWMYKRIRNRYMRSTHFLLSFLWVTAVAVHGGGQFLLIAFGTIVVWGIIWLLEKRTLYVD